VLDPHFSVIPLGLELELDVEAADLGVLEALGLLLKPSITERLFECDTLDQDRVLHAASGDLLDPDQRLVEVVLVEHLHGIDDHFGEEGLLGVDEF
jgi:hypothetical protein